MVDSPRLGATASWHLRGAQRLQDRASARVVSGLRIYSASDDPAGLGITNRLGARLRSVQQAMRNAGEGVALMQAAEAGLVESTSLLYRLRELALQAASDTSTTGERLFLQDAVEQLVAQFDRITQGTEYNTSPLFDGSFVDRDLHLGPSLDETLRVELPDLHARALGVVTTTSTSEPGTAVVSSTVPVDQNALAVGEVELNGSQVDASFPADDALSTLFPEASAIAKAAAINRGTATHSVTASALPAELEAPGPVVGGDLQDKAIYINGVNIGAVAGILAGDSDGTLAGAINLLSGTTGVTAAATGGVMTLTADDGRNIELDVKRNGALTGFVKANDQMGFGRIQLSASVDITVGGPLPFSRIGIAPGTTIAGSTTITSTTLEALSNISVETKEDANDALDLIDSSLEQVSATQADVGALHARLDVTLESLQSYARDLESGRSRILDVDFARENAIIAAAQVRKDLNGALLAQANARPGVVNDLLGGSLHAVASFRPPRIGIPPMTPGSGAGAYRQLIPT